MRRQWIFTGWLKLHVRARHESALYFKRNVLTGCFIPHKLLNRQTFSAFALDWFTFGNAYLELPRNRPAAR